MKFDFSLLLNEVKLISKEKLLYTAMIVPIVLMVVGINSINLSNEMSLHNIRRTSLTCALGSSRYGALSMALSFSIFTILILSKDKRKNTNAVINGIIDNSKLLFIRMNSLIFYGVINTFIGMILAMCFQRFYYKSEVIVSDYIYCYSIITFMAVIFSIFISAGIYLMIQSMDVTILIMIILFFISFISNNYMFNYIQTNAVVFSDFAGLRPVSKLIIYNRMLYMVVSLAVFMTGLLLRRRFEKNTLKSILINLKNKILLISAVLLICTSIFTAYNDPYCMKNNNGMKNEEINKNINLKKVTPEIVFNTKNESMKADVSYEFENISLQKSVLFAINEGLKIKNITVNNKACSYTKSDKGNNIEITIPAEKNIKINILYEGRIKYYKGGAVAGYISKDSIYLLENSNYILKPLTQIKELILVEGSFEAPCNLWIVTPGRNTSVETKGQNKKWNFNYKSRSFDFGVFGAEYKKEILKADGMDIEFYYSPKHEKYIKSDILNNHMNIEKYIKGMFDYYSKNIGKYYTNEYPLKIVETSIYKTGGHSSGNVVTFSEYMVNRDLKSNVFYYDYVHDISIIAHEVAHQWWGSGVNVYEEEAFSCEGFAEYMSYKYISEEFKVEEGRTYGNIVYDSWQHEVEKLDRNYYLKNRENMKKLNKNYKEQLDNEFLKIQHYDLMPFILCNLEEKQKNDKFLKNLSKVYKNNVNGELTYEEFLKEMRISKEEFSYE